MMMLPLLLHSPHYYDRLVLEKLISPHVYNGVERDLAAQMLAKFGSLSEVLSAPRHRLLEIPDLGVEAADAITVIMQVSQRLAKDRVQPHLPLMSSWNALLDYLHADMAFLTRERTRILHLDKKNRLIADEIMNEGTVDFTPVFPREVIRRALELSATAMILVHNHPSGDPSPSSADVQMTRAIADVAKPLGITVHDHIIIGKSGHASLKAMLLM
jgi:DNA repair protein RadC